MLKMTSTAKLKVENFHLKLRSHITKQLLTTISVDIRIYLPLKVIFISAMQPFLVDKSSCLPH